MSSTKYQNPKQHETEVYLQTVRGRRLPFIQYHTAPFRLPMGRTFLPSRARFLVAVVVAAAATVFAMDVLPTRVNEDEDATEPAVECRRGCTIVTPLDSL